MSDEEIEEWAKSVYQDFVQSAKKEFRRLRFFN